MKPASATSRGAAGVEFGAERRIEAGAIGELLHRHHAGRDAERGGARQAAGAVAIGDHSNYADSG